MGDKHLERYGVTSKELTQDEIQEILKLSNMESEVVEKKDLNKDSNDSWWSFYMSDDNYYWEINYKGRKIELNKLPFSEEILKIK